MSLFRSIIDYRRAVADCAKGGGERAGANSPPFAPTSARPGADTRGQSPSTALARSRFAIILRVISAVPGDDATVTK
jgi:hypothetical protein